MELCAIFSRAIGFLNELSAILGYNEMRTVVFNKKGDSSLFKFKSFLESNSCAASSARYCSELQSAWRELQKRTKKDAQARGTAATNFLGLVRFSQSKDVLSAHTTGATSLLDEMIEQHSLHNRQAVGYVGGELPLQIQDIASSKLFQDVNWQPGSKVPADGRHGLYLRLLLLASILGRDSQLLAAQLTQHDIQEIQNIAVPKVEVNNLVQAWKYRFEQDKEYLRLKNIRVNRIPSVGTLEGIVESSGDLSVVMEAKSLQDIYLGHIVHCCADLYTGKRSYHIVEDLFDCGRQFVKLKQSNSIIFLGWTVFAENAAKNSTYMGLLFTEIAPKYNGETPDKKREFLKVLYRGAVGIALSLGFDYFFVKHLDYGNLPEVLSYEALESIGQVEKDTQALQKLSGCLLTDSPYQDALDAGDGPMSRNTINLKTLRPQYAVPPPHLAPWPRNSQ